MNPNDQILAYTNLKVIFDEFYKPLVSYANNYIHSKIECEDIVQDVFVSIWEKKTSFPNKLSLQGYLYKAVRNSCYDYIKHEKVKKTYADNSLHILQDDNVFLKQVMEEEITRELYNAIKTLSQRKKEVIKLSLDNLKNKDIASKLNIKLQTVKTIKSQAYKILREKFRDNTTIINFLIFTIIPVNFSKKYRLKKNI